MDTNHKEHKEKDVINLGELIKKVYRRKRSFILPLSLVFIFSCVYVFSLPRYYTTDSKLVPELGATMPEGTLGSIASSFGIDIGEAQGTDAITPLLYPDLMEDNAFVVRLFDIQVETLDGSVKTTYHDYLCHHQKAPWWNGFTSWLSGLLKKKPTKNGADEGSSPYQLSMGDNDLANGIRGNISLSIDKKTGVITINVKDQDPKICKTLADTMQVYLQEFITDYRTKKARVDVEHYEQLCAEALRDYDKARIAYARKADANRNAVLQRVAMEINDLESDMQLKYTTYTTYNAQLQVAYAKLQERTPAFTIIKGASVPVRPAGPKRMMFILGMLVLTSLCVTMYLLKDTLWKF